MSYWRLETGAYTFYLTISKGSGNHTISIGGRKGECVNISVNTPESLAVQRGYHSLDAATIPVLGWNARCAGSGTIAMINTILSEAVKRYPYVKMFTFTDNSHITCDNGNGISLLSLSVVEHRKTWYERNFNATLVDSTLAKKYQDGLKILEDPELKLPFSDFKNIINSYTTTSTALKPYYENSANYFEFFGTILRAEGKSGLCNLIADWIDIFLSYIFQFNPLTASWAIPSDSITEVLTTEFKLNRKPANQIGGRRSTRRNSSRVNINDIIELE